MVGSVDPMYELWRQTFLNSGYSKTPTVDGQTYDFSTDPIEMYKIEQEKKEEEKKKETGNSIDPMQREYGRGPDLDKYGNRMDARDTPYAYEPEYWHSDAWAPDYSLGDYAKTAGYGLGLLKTGKGLMSNILGLNPLSNPLNDPGNIEGISQMGSAYGFDPDLMKTAIANVYAGPGSSDAKAPSGILDGIIGGFSDIAKDGLSGFGNFTDAEIFANDTIRGLLGMTTDKWGDYNWADMGYTTFDPAKAGAVSRGNIDPHHASQLMDAYEQRSKRTGTGMPSPIEVEKHSRHMANEPYPGFNKLLLERIANSDDGDPTNDPGFTGLASIKAAEDSGLYDMMDKPLDEWDNDTIDDFIDRKADLLDDGKRNSSNNNGGGNGGSNTNSGGNNRGSGRGASVGVGSNGRGSEGDYGFH